MRSASVSVSRSTKPVVLEMRMTEDRPRFSKPMALLWMLRPSRTVMVAMITGAAACVAGAGVLRSLWMTLAGWCLAAGGFSLSIP